MALSWLGAACAGPPPAAPPAVAPPVPPAAAPAPAPVPAPEPAQTRYAPEVEQRIERVTRGLLAETARRGQFAPPAALADRLAYYHTPGVSIAVVHGGKVEWARGFGLRDVEGGKPVTEETVFQAGSISKPVFALAVLLRLVVAGKLSLDEDVNRYLTSWKVPPQGSFAPRITLQHLLSHSAGLTTHGFLGYLRSEPLPTVPQVLDGAPPANSPAVRVNLLPGVRFRYSGGGTTVAQLAVTDTLGKPFPEIMDEQVLRPLGMAHSTYAQPLPEAWHARASTAYPWKAQAVPGRWHVYPEMAAAGLWTTAADLARAGLEVGRAARGESSFLPRDLARKMLTRQLPGSDVGIGFFLFGKGATTRFAHNGWDQGFCAEAVFYVESGEGAVVMVNSNEGQALQGEILRAVAREYAWPDFFTPEKTADPKAAPPPDAVLGDYETEKGARFAVRRSEGRSSSSPPASRPSSSGPARR
jgi:CubicO group peptidase (beta-lactamase class C family)